MTWTIHASLACLISAFILFLVYYYLYTLAKERCLALWAVGWFLHGLRFAFEIGLIFYPLNSWLFMGNQFFSLLSSLFILWGTFNFLGKQTPKLLIYGTIGGGLWIVIGALTGLSFAQIILPTFIITVFIYIQTGLGFLQYKEINGLIIKVLGWTFILFGIHQVNYPMLTQLNWFAPWDYLVGAIFILTIGVGITLVYFLKTKQVLAVSEERFRLLAENAKDIIFRYRWAPELAMDYVSPSVTEITGYTPENYYANPDLSINIVHPEDRHLVAGLAKADMAVNALNLRWIRKDGQIIWVEMQYTQIYDNKGILTGAEGIIRDISERKKAEEAIITKTAELAIAVAELERSNRELDQFAYVVSHDLKAPLRAIANLSQWIEEDLGEAVEGDTLLHIDMLRGRVRRLENFIEGILQYSRVGKISSSTQKVDVGELLNEIIEELAPPSGLKIEVGSNMPTFITDQIRLRQVLANLIDNAFKYHDQPKGCVKIAVADAGEFFEFKVIDDGPGIAPEYHEKVFETFQTLQPRDQVESTGIGLSLVKKIVEASGGSIRINSAVGAGTTFSIHWPKGI